MLVHSLEQGWLADILLAALFLCFLWWFAFWTKEAWICMTKILKSCPLCLPSWICFCHACRMCTQSLGCYLNFTDTLTNNAINCSCLSEGCLHDFASVGLSFYYSILSDIFPVLRSIFQDFGYDTCHGTILWSQGMVPWHYSLLLWLATNLNICIHFKIQLVCVCVCPCVHMFVCACVSIDACTATIGSWEDNLKCQSSGTFYLWFGTRAVILQFYCICQVKMVLEASRDPPVLVLLSLHMCTAMPTFLFKWRIQGSSFRSSHLGSKSFADCIFFSTFRMQYFY